ncbi:alpha/beta hydrolase [Halochromatium glycolicum]|nr:alpha/beta hydrolase [Halochromatium glycolicum]
MSGLAKALATQGIPVATLDFCNMRPWDGRHQQNGLDMIALAEHLKVRVGAGQIVYSGFSAGGLAALVAARNDPNAIGAVTLDLVDAQGIGLRAVRELDKPLLGLAGEPTNCNAGNNARAVFAASDDARVQPIPGAGHCDFEAPTDALCELLCEDPDQAQPTRTAALREQIIATATDAIESMIEDEPSRPETAG